MKCSDIERKLSLLSLLDNCKENTGLIVGRSDKNVSTVVVAYRVDKETVEYAVSVQADMIISYEPVIKEPLLTIKSQSYQGRILLQLLRHDIACYSLGRGFDMCDKGMAEWIAARMELSGDYEKAYSTQKGFTWIGQYNKEKSLEEITKIAGEAFQENEVRVFTQNVDKKGMTDAAVVVWADDKSIDEAIERGAQFIITCDIAYSEAVRACSENKAVIVLSGETAENSFTDCMEQYLAEVLSSSVEILTMPVKRKSRIFISGKEEV